MDFSISHIVSGGLLLCRIAPALRLTPFFGGAPMPVVVWIPLSAVLSMVLLPSAGEATLPLDALHLFALAAKEIFIGVVIGALCRTAFCVLESAGHLVRRAMFNTPSVPQSDTSAEIYSLLCIAVLLSLGGHHTFIQGLAATLRCAPLHLFPDAAFAGGPDTAIEVFSGAMGAAALIAAPVFAAAFISDLLFASLSQLFFGLTAPAADAARIWAVQLAVIAGFAWTVRAALDFIISCLNKTAAF
jgi:flagellar biosynthesis protein FliR